MRLSLMFGSQGGEEQSGTSSTNEVFVSERFGDLYTVSFKVPLVTPTSAKGETAGQHLHTCHLLQEAIILVLINTAFDRSHLQSNLPAITSAGTSQTLAD
ncbi:hypothetical protein Cadr_000027461 [Camelus dromedarius]|uniref:Uncharacterized protein n=1 Tax=Camelus dromedarius TaxID=9838 RepID=A0A5N4CCF7_CAMDR|nr:hypothetical protein Cadr_000027461 [Camelus dromedarius]